MLSVLKRKWGLIWRGKRVHAGLEQKLLVLLEVHLNARVVPNLDGYGDGHGGGQQEQRDGPPILRIDEKEPLRLGGMAKREPA